MTNCCWLLRLSKLVVDVDWMEPESSFSNNLISYTFGRLVDRPPDTVDLLDDDMKRIETNWMRCIAIATMFTLALLCSVKAEGQELDDQQSAVRTAFKTASEEKRLNAQTFETIHAWMTKTSGKEKWRQIKWRTDLWEARKESAKQGKPIFIWAMDGDPLGCV